MSVNKLTKDVKKKPSFIRTDGHKKKRLGLKWRKPKGLQNKRRLMKRGYSVIVKKGYKASNETRGLTKKGLKPIMIISKEQLKEINKTKEGIIISSTLGNKKKLDILEEVKKLGLVVLNLNVDEKIDSIKESIAKKKKIKQEKVRKEKDKPKEKSKSIEDSVKKEDDKSKSEKKEDLSDDEKKEKEKKDYDKLLTSKNQ